MTNGDYGLFNTVLTGPASLPYWVGWGLLALGFAVRIALANLRLAAGEPPEFGRIVLDAFLAMLGLSSYSFFPHWIWAAGQSLAYRIYPSSKMEALGGLLAQAAARFQDYSFSVLDVGRGLKDGAVLITALLSWLMALIGHLEIQTFQSVAWNVLFCFGPMLIGASAFGIPTARTWLNGLIQISSWSLAAAVVYATIGSTLEKYLLDAREAPLLDTRFLDVVNNLVFLGLLPLLVPTLVGWFLGGSIAGALSKAAASSPMLTSFASMISTRMGFSPSRQGGGGVSPPSTPPKSPPTRRSTDL